MEFPAFRGLCRSVGVELKIRSSGAGSLSSAWLPQAPCVRGITLRTGSASALREYLNISQYVVSSTYEGFRTRAGARGFTALAAYPTSTRTRYERLR